MVRINLLLFVALSIGNCQLGLGQTPHAVLWNSPPEKGQIALEIMKQDPEWVTRRDDYGRTPLHVAARFDHVAVVEWLLDNGADVNAKAYNDFTPLHLTTNPEIVKLILARNPNLQQEAVNGTVLQNAIEDLRFLRERSIRVPEMRETAESIQRIVDIYVDYLDDEIDLISAIRLGELETVKKLVQQNPADAHRKSHLRNPLREAANWGHLDICKFLVEGHAVDVNDFEGGAGYPVIIAALKYPEIVKYLIDHGADLETRITFRGGRTGYWIIGDNATALHFAARDGVPESVKALLDAGIDPFATDQNLFDEEDKQTAMEVAAKFGMGDNAIAILEHPSFQRGDASVRQELLNVTLAAGIRSSGRSESQHCATMIDSLIEHGADLATLGGESSPIHIAVAHIYPGENETNEVAREIISVLRKHGVEMDLYSATAVEDLNLLADLIAKDAQTSGFPSKHGYPALEFAVQMNSLDAARMLLDAGYGAIDEQRLNHGVTLLHLAVANDSFAVAELLLERGANIAAKDHDGNTPMDYANDDISFEKFENLFSRFEK